MLLKPKTVEEQALLLLKDGSLGTVELLEKINSSRAGTTKQAFYQALRKLRKEEVVVLYSKRVSLSHIWIEKMSDYLSKAKMNYGAIEKPNEDFLILEDGEKVSYNFKNPTTMDIFWGHAFGILSNKIAKDEAVLIHNPHEWFLVAREESEKLLFAGISNNNRRLFLLCGKNTGLDRNVKTHFDGDRLQYHILEKPLFEKENYYINIFGNYIIEAWIDESVAKEIDDFYIKNKTIGKETIEELKHIVSKKGRNKLVISNNKRKARKMKAMFKKYFVIKK